MSLQIVQTPLKVVNQDIPENSKWSAGWHPVIWRFLRRDFEVKTISFDSTSPGGIAVVIDGDHTDEIEEQDMIYLNASDGNVEGSFEVYSVSYDIGADETTIFIDEEDIVTYADNGYLNLVDKREFYKLQIRITGYANGVAEVLNEENLGVFRPNTIGLTKCDIAEWLRQMLSPENDYNYVARTEGETSFGCRYDIEVRQYWKLDGVEVVSVWYDTNDLDGGDLDEHYISNSVRQIGQTFGQNMADFVMWATNPTYEHNKGMFLTMFETPTYFVGYPFSLGFIYDKKITDASQRLSIVEDRLDINGISVSDSDDLIDDTNETITHAAIKAVVDSEYASTVKKCLFYLKATEIVTGDDASATWQLRNTGTNSGIAAVDTTNGTTIGFADFNTDVLTTVADLIASINTNTPNGTPFTGQPFDNSIGYTASVVLPSGLNQAAILISAPTGGGAAYNSVNITLYFDAGTWTVTPSAGQLLSGGTDETQDDAEGLTTARVSEIKTIIVDQECYNNIIYLRWLNPLGYYDYWLFNSNYLVRDAITDEQTIEKYVEEIGDENSRKKTISKSAQEEISVRAEFLTKQQMEGLRYLLSSIHVQRYIPNDTGFTWMTVRVKQSVFDIEEAIENKGVLECIILPPEKYNQQQ